MRVILRNLLAIALTSVILTACKEEPKEIKKKEEEPKVEEPAPILVSEANMTLINKMTATWCGPCGQWGWTLFQDIIDATEHDALIMGTYASSTSKYYNQVADDFKLSQAPSAGWPAFCANGYNRTEYSSTGSIYTSITKDNVVAEVAKHKAKPVIVNAGYKTTVTDDKIKIDVRTKFFQNGDDGTEYYLGVYIMEDGVIGYQNGKGNDAAHHHVLRGSFTGNTYGVKIENGTNAGSIFEKSFELGIDPTWNKDNLEFGVVIWKKLGVKYLFVNAFQAKD